MIDFFLQFLGSRGMATVTDSPLDKKVEMTHWEKVRESTHSYGALRSVGNRH